MSACSRTRKSSQACPLTIRNCAGSSRTVAHLQQRRILSPTHYARCRKNRRKSSRISAASIFVCNPRTRSRSRSMSSNSRRVAARTVPRLHEASRNYATMQPSRRRCLAAWTHSSTRPVTCWKIARRHPSPCRQWRTAMSSTRSGDCRTQCSRRTGAS